MEWRLFGGKEKAKAQVKLAGSKTKQYWGAGKVHSRPGDLGDGRMTSLWALIKDGNPTQEFDWLVRLLSQRNCKLLRQADR